MLRRVVEVLDRSAIAAGADGIGAAACGEADVTPPCGGVSRSEVAPAVTNVTFLSIFPLAFFGRVAKMAGK